MLISTANDLPGYQITEVLGEVFGLTVRARNIGSQFGAGLKSLMGGELKGMTINLANSRNEVIQRMVDEAAAKGGNAIVGMRFDTSEMGGTWTEICAYGTAVIANRVSAPALRRSKPPLGLRKSIEPERRQVDIARPRRHALRDRLAELRLSA